MDNLSKEKRSLNMSHIKGTNTSIEIKVRKYLYHYGFRYRINYKELVGKPDIVLKKYKTVIFINGCFWHRHINCKYATVPKSNTEYWEKKFKKIQERDKIVCALLKEEGWKVIILWECEIKDDFYKIMEEVVQTIKE